MEAVSLDDLTILLSSALSDNCLRAAAINKFQRLIFANNLLPTGATERDMEILVDLAHDLDFYQPVAVLRREDTSLIDDEKAEELIKNALALVSG